MTSLDSTAVQDGVSAQRSAGTPSSFREAVFPALEALEFGRALEIVAGFAAGPLGGERIRSRRPAADPEWIRAELAPVDELLGLYARRATLDVVPVPPLEAVLGRLRLPGAVLEGIELVAVRQTLSAARAAVADLGRLTAEAPTVAGWVVPLPNPAIDKRLAQSLDPTGEVLDTASPALLRARREVQESRTRLVKKLEVVLRGLDSHGADPGASVTMRNGRYVVPVRRDYRARPEGIVHDESASGETVFLEPTAAIELGNALRAAIADAEREVLRVLRDLTEVLRPNAGLIEGAHGLCVRLDDLVARVRYAHSVGARVPGIRPGGAGVALRQARHPLLLGRGIPAVPFDLVLDGVERTLLVSGPNAGGKTVLLKTVGLTAALVQSGIVPPLGPGSELPVFQQIVADIGDHQSIAADLSTFTAHLVVLRGVLEEAGSGTLVLVDEIGSGTDPAEGGALAAAALRALTRRGAMTIATTHLGSLKALATQTAGIVNGSLQFDPDRLAPTFRFAKGTPGRSYGLAIARRLGIRAEVLAEAEGRISEAERSLDGLLEAAEARERCLAAAQAELDSRLAEAERELARLTEQAAVQQARETALRTRERSAERHGRTEARRVMLEARERVEEAIRSAQGATSEPAAREARRLLEEAIRREGEALEALDQEGVGRSSGPAAAPLLREGQRVRFGSGSLGRVAELRDDGLVMVVAGNVRVVVSASELLPVEEGAKGARGARGKAASPSSSPIELGARFEVDLRGLRADEAELATRSALDAAILADQPYLRIIHGMGTGALRLVVRQVLATDGRVAKFAFAPGNQGGTGVTVAEFAE